MTIYFIEIHFAALPSVRLGLGCDGRCLAAPCWKILFLTCFCPHLWRTWLLLRLNVAYYCGGRGEARGSFQSIKDLIVHWALYRHSLWRFIYWLKIKLYFHRVDTGWQHFCVPLWSFKSFNRFDKVLDESVDVIFIDNFLFSTSWLVFCVHNRLYLKNHADLIVSMVL